MRKLSHGVLFFAHSHLKLKMILITIIWTKILIKSQTYLSNLEVISTYENKTIVAGLMGQWVKWLLEVPASHMGTRQSGMFHFQSSSLGMCPEKQQQMAQVLGSLLCMWEIWTKFLAPNFLPGPVQAVWPFEE